jgi:hypothetical protein
VLISELFIFEAMSEHFTDIFLSHQYELFTLFLFIRFKRSCSARSRLANDTCVSVGSHRGQLILLGFSGFSYAWDNCVYVWALGAMFVPRLFVSLESNSVRHFSLLCYD